MNLFRGNRRSSLDEENSEAAESLLSRGASICRGFLPRSRTSSSNLGTTQANSSNACVGNNASSATASDWAYVSSLSQPQPQLQPPQRRTASLSRNLTRRNRSVTMPNMNKQQDSNQFSTFKIQPQPPSSRPQSRPLLEVKKPSNIRPSRSASSSYLSQYGTIGNSHTLKNRPRDLTTSNTEGCLSLLAEEINGEETPIAGTPDVSQDRRKRAKKQLSSLDSLLDSNQEAITTSEEALEATPVSYSNKSNSLPKSAFGNLQLRMAKIKAQLDTIKNDLKTPTAPEGLTQHPNTPSVGYEYSMPPNLVGDESPTTSSSSPNRQSPFTTTTSTSSSCGLSKLPHPPFLPLTTTTGSSTMSSSPSTLSPASSNSLPSISRPQNLKLPQSHSLNAFPAASNMINKEQQQAMIMMETEELNRLIFFFDVMSTQEKIAKVHSLYTIAVSSF